MKKLLIGLFVVFCLFKVYEMVKPPPKFTGGAQTLQVERLGADGKIVREDFQPRLAPYLAVYHGAGWCGPCQQFSPILAKFYHDVDKKNLPFQLLMVDYDRSDADMVAYMRQHEMEFPAIARAKAGAWGVSTGSGIPNLIIIDTATGKVAASSFNGSNYVGCYKPLQALRTIIAQGHL
jgi:thiol-disulfide isomerase/thioredoxin